MDRLLNLPEILYDARWVGNHGIGRFAAELQKLLPNLTPLQGRRPPFHPLDPLLLGAELWRRKPKLFFSPGYNSPLGWPGAFVFTLHDLNHLRVPENSSTLKRAYYEHIIKPACRRAQCVLTVSEYSKQEIAGWAGVASERIVNVGNGIGPVFRPDGPKYDPGYPYLLYVGSRKAHKNLLRLLAAYAISEVRNDVRLIISGSPDRLLVQKISRLGIEPQVLFKELSDDGPLSEAYRGAVAFVFPSLYEGFGLPPLEAMACGVPVISSNVCSLPEVLADAAVLVDPLSVQAIAVSINRVVQDSSLRATLRKKGPLRASLFSWEATAQKTWQALQFAGVPNRDYGRHVHAER